MGDLMQPGRSISTTCADEWLTEVCHMFTELAVDKCGESNFVGRASRREILDLKFTSICAGGQVVKRSEREIKREITDQFFLILQERGNCQVFSRDGDAVHMQPGDSILVNPQIPYILSFDQPADQVCIQMPAADLRDRVCKHENLIFGRKIDRGNSVSRILSAAIDDLAESAERRPRELHSSVDLFYDVVAGCLRRIHLTHHDASAAPRIGAFNKLVGFIVRNHTLEALTPTDAAAELGLSIRSLSRLCVENGTTFSKLVLNARLTAAAHELREAGGDARGRITRVAFEHGFADLSYFSRSFKEKYGVSPAKFIHRR